MAQTITLGSVLQSRESTYRMLARLHEREVDTGYLQKLRAMRCPVNTGNADVDEGYRLFHRYLSRLWERSLEDLQRDYLRVFIGANTTGHAAAYPNESVHTSPLRMVMQDARDEVIEAYRAAGLEASSKWNAGEDHISLELTYLAIMGKRASEAYAKGKRSDCATLLMAQYRFLIDHLQNWIGFLTHDMLKFAQTDFYRALAYLTQGVLDEDRAFLETVLEEELALERELQAQSDAGEALEDSKREESVAV